MRIDPTETVLTNANGVKIDGKYGHHHASQNALCHCGDVLFVAPPICKPEHKKGDPVMVCADHGVHDFRFSELVIGVQKKALQKTTPLDLNMKDLDPEIAEVLSRDREKLYTDGKAD